MNLSNEEFERCYERFEEALMNLSEEDLLKISQPLESDRPLIFDTTYDLDTRRRHTIRCMFGRVRDLRDYAARFRAARDGLRQLL